MWKRYFITRKLGLLRQRIQLYRWPVGAVGRLWSWSRPHFRLRRSLGSWGLASALEHAHVKDLKGGKQFCFGLTNPFKIWDFRSLFAFLFKANNKHCCGNKEFKRLYGFWKKKILYKVGHCFFKNRDNKLHLRTQKWNQEILI